MRFIKDKKLTFENPSPLFRINKTWSRILCWHLQDRGNASGRKRIWCTLSLCASSWPDGFPLRFSTGFNTVQEKSTCPLTTSWRGPPAEGWVQMSHCITEPTKWPVCAAKTHVSLGICPGWSVFTVYMKNQPRHLPRLISLHCLHEEHWALNYLLCAQWKLIRQGGYPGWSEFLLGTGRTSFCWFCCAAAQMLPMNYWIH